MGCAKHISRADLLELLVTDQNKRKNYQLQTLAGHVTIDNIKK